MKNATVRLLLVLTLGTTGCHTSVVPTEAYTTNISQARMWFTGQWKLTKESTQMLNPTVPDVRLLIDPAGQITVIDNGQQIDKVDFDIIQTSVGFALKTNAQPRSDNWYVRNPGLQISSNRMFLDAGMANDGPGFDFERVK